MSVEEEILKSGKIVAIVGLSSNTERASNRVGGYLKANGYRIIPVNPVEKSVLGETSYPDLNAIPEQVDIVDIFRKPEDVLPVVEDAVKIGAKAVWLQEGIINEEAADYARKAGLKMVMDRCMLKEHMKLKGAGS
ncbi:MAG: CoA-binding protein [Dehalococcoidales bacterium]|nr:CoA-binding protein [Dehalococcoidales bacterium]